MINTDYFTDYILSILTIMIAVEYCLLVRHYHNCYSTAFQTKLQDKVTAMSKFDSATVNKQEGNSEEEVIQEMGF